MAHPGGHAVAELHHHAGGTEAAHRPRRRDLLEEADDQILGEVQERDAEHAEEEREVGERERLGAERRAGVREEAHLERRARQRLAVGFTRPYTLPSGLTTSGKRLCISMTWRSSSFTTAMNATHETARQRIVRRAREPVNGHFHQTSGMMTA